MSWKVLQRIFIYCFQPVRTVSSSSILPAMSGKSNDILYSSSGHQRWTKSPYRIKQLRYSRHILNLINKGKMAEAIGVFESMRKNQVKPEAVVFNSLIGGFGKQRNIEESFRIFNQMKKRGLVPTDHTYTSMLSACADVGPRAESILSKLESEMERRGVRLNSIGANAHISALASCRQQEDALKAYLNMLKTGTEPDLHTYSGLLLSSSKDGRGGVLVAQRVWEEMLSSGHQPDLYCFNLLLQCLRDAGLEGTHTETTEEVVCIPAVDVCSHMQEALCKTDSIISEWTGSKNRPISVEQTGSFNFKISRNQSLVINLGSVPAGTSKDSVMRWLDRVSVQTLFERLRSLSLTADIHTYHLLLQLVLSPNAVLRCMEECGVRPDERAMVAAVRVQSRLGNLAGAKALLAYSRSLDVDGGQSGYQALATCCKGEREGLELLEEMKAAGLVPNEYVFGTLIGGALRERNYEYMTTLLKRMRHCEVVPSKTIIEMLETASKFKPKSPSHVRRHNGFKGYYNIWKKLMVPTDTDIL